MERICAILHMCDTTNNQRWWQLGRLLQVEEVGGDGLGLCKRKSEFAPHIKLLTIPTIQCLRWSAFMHFYECAMQQSTANDGNLGDLWVQELSRRQWPSCCSKWTAEPEFPDWTPFRVLWFVVFEMHGQVVIFKCTDVLRAKNEKCKIKRMMRWAGWAGLQWEVRREKWEATKESNRQKVNKQ